MGRRLKTYGKGVNLGTIATTGNTDDYIVVPKSGKIAAVYVSPGGALGASDTNYLTFSLVNLGQAGAGSANALSTADTNTTKATGGSALALDTKRSLVLNPTAANLLVTEGDRLRFRAAATGTLAGTVPNTKAEILIDANGQ